MAWTAEVTQKSRDTSNFNIAAEIKYTDGVTTIVERFGGVDLTDAQIAEQARKRIKNVLEVGDTALAVLTLGPVSLPADPVVGPEEQALIEASKVFRGKLADAQIAALNDVDAANAYAALKAAQAALDAKG